MKRIVFSTIAAIFLIWLTIWFFSEDVAKEEKAIREVDYTAQFNEMLPRAEKGDSKAQFIVARLLHLGKGVDRDFGAAFKWYVKAADKGHAAARYQIGAMFEKGEGVPQDVFKAAEWYKLAAGFGGNADAQFAMGRLYFNGRGVPHDYSEAFSWYQKAANRGHAAAQVLVGSMYRDGWSVESDYTEAYKWYTLAIPKAKQAIAVNSQHDPVKAREKLVKRMNRFQIEQGEKRAREWLKKNKGSR